MFKFNCVINYLLLISIYSCVLIFTFPVINNYIIHNNWNETIPNLGDNLTQRFLILSHILLGIISMIIYPLQKLLNKNNHIRHYFIGGFLVIISIITSIMGNLYIFLYGTIGGVWMSVSFSFGGILFFILSIAVPISGYMHKKSLFNATNLDYFGNLYDHDRQKTTKKFHLLIINLFGAYIYASLFYRQLYFQAYIFGYSSSNPPNPSDYERPLDRSFQILFYVLPLLFMSIYTFVNRNFQRMLKIVLFIYSIYILIITLLLIQTATN